MFTGGVTIRTDYIKPDVMKSLLDALTYENRLVLIVSLTTGLRLSDVLNLKTSDIKDRFTVRELKTGKNRTVRLSPKLLDELLSVAGKIFVFENRLDYRKHRTRQAVFKDLKRASRLFRVPCNVVVAPHTARKIYAVSEYQGTANIKRVQELLNHSSEAVTVLYAMADEITAKKYKSSR